MSNIEKIEASSALNYFDTIADSTTENFWVTQMLENVTMSAGVKFPVFGSPTTMKISKNSKFDIGTTIIVKKQTSFYFVDVIIAFGDLCGGILNLSKRGVDSRKLSNQDLEDLAILAVLNEAQEILLGIPDEYYHLTDVGFSKEHLRSQMDLIKVTSPSFGHLLSSTKRTNIPYSHTKSVLSQISSFISSSVRTDAMKNYSLAISDELGVSSLRETASSLIILALSTGSFDDIDSRPPKQKDLINAFRKRCIADISLLAKDSSSMEELRELAELEACSKYLYRSTARSVSFDDSNRILRENKYYYQFSKDIESMILDLWRFHDIDMIRYVISKWKDSHF